MKAIQIHKFGDASVLQYETIPTPQPAPGEVLIKVEAASVNYSDIARRGNSTYPFPTPLPFIPGGEVAGVIESLGEGVAEPPVGTPVFALVGTGSNGYAQYAVTSADQVIPIPDGVSLEQAASLPIAGTTAMMLVRELGNLQAGEKILIQGAAGGVGTFAIQIAKLLDASTVIGATSSNAKFDKILDSGADHVIDYSQPDWPEQVRSLTDGYGVDLILEMNGGPVFTQAIQCLAPFGRILVYGMASGVPLTLDEQTIRHFFYDPSLNQSIHVFNLGLQFGMRPQRTAQAMSDLIELVASGKIRVSVDTQLPLSQAVEAHQLIENREATGKIILKPWEDV